MRYALYFSPAADHPLTKTASRWLGRDAFSGERFETAVVDGIPEEDVHALTADPRRYAFHATLKAPFELAEGRSEAELIEALERFAAATPGFDIPNAVIGQLGRFFALVPDQVYPELQAFAARVVQDFEPFRAPLSAADIARRKPETLPEPERTYLHDWGYPYVFDAFRFHMTLTGPVPAERQDEVAAHLETRFSSLIGGPLPVRGLALCIEPERGAPFRVLTLAALSAAHRKMA